MRHFYKIFLFFVFCAAFLTGCDDSYKIESFGDGIGSTEVTEIEITEKEAISGDINPEDRSDSSDNKDFESSIIYVYVCGAVKKPDVYELPEGSIAKDAIEMAGGLTDSAAVNYINPAKRISDGERIFIPTEEEIQSGTFPEDIYEADENAIETGKININTAKKDELMKLPGIGSSKAEAIIAYREEHGAFSDIKEIMNVSGIGENIYEKLKDKVTV